MKLESAQVGTFKFVPFVPSSDPVPGHAARGVIDPVPGRLKGLHDPVVMADFGQTDFGQTDFGQFFDRVWPIVVLTDFGQTDFGQS